MEGVGFWGSFWVWVCFLKLVNKCVLSIFGGLGFVLGVREWWGVKLFSFVF